jgi:hypothetical protein
LIPAPVGPPGQQAQNQGFAYAQDGTVTVTGPNTPNVWTGVTVQQANGVDYTVRDTIGDVTCPKPGAPVLTLPSNITAEATSAAGAVVTFTASATDANPPHPAVTCTPASGSTFAIMTTTVNCSATDAAGNTATGSFTVTVQDTTPPVLRLPDNITAEATGPNGAVVTFAPTANDLVDGSRPVTCTPASGSTFAITTTTVNCSSTDKSGNTASGSFTVTVKGASGQVSDQITLVQSLSGTSAAIKPSLIDKLNIIQASLNAGQTTDACNQLAAYINQITGLQGKTQISQADATMLINNARRIMAVLGC